MLPEWLWIILVGGIIMGLVAYITSMFNGRITKMEEWKDKQPQETEVLTISKHDTICGERLSKAFEKQTDDLEKLFMLRVENVILKEVRKINGTKDELLDRFNDLSKEELQKLRLILDNELTELKAGKNPIILGYAIMLARIDQKLEEK